MINAPAIKCCYVPRVWIIHKHTFSQQTSTQTRDKKGLELGKQKTLWHGHLSSKPECYKRDEGKATRIENSY